MKTPNWRTAATLIITKPSIGKKISHQPHQCLTTNYDVLMLKRSATSKFFPNVFVFPGGGLDKADSTLEWFEIFKYLDSNFMKKLESLILKPSDRLLSPMMTSHALNVFSDLPSDISYRICAIRETFEETGLLLATQTPQCNRDNFSHVFQFDNFESVNFWRKKVHKDAHNFLHLCKSLRCVPDIWHLQEWSNWLTPQCNGMKPSKRYDTVFYTAAISESADFVEEDNKEVTEIEWRTSDDYLKNFYEGNFSLGPPQVFELSRTLKFNDHQQFINFCVERGKEGLERYLPLYAITKDNILLTLYPGDEDYKFGMVQTLEDDPIQLNVSLKDIVDSYSQKRYNRTIGFGKLNQLILLSNSNMPLGHVNPVSSLHFVKTSNL